MFSRKEKFLIFITAVTVSYVILANHEEAKRLYDCTCNKVKDMMRKLAPR